MTSILFKETARDYILEADENRRNDKAKPMTKTHPLHKATMMAEEAMFEAAMHKYLKSHPKASKQDIYLGYTDENMFQDVFDAKVDVYDDVYSFKIPYVHHIKSSSVRSSEGMITKYLMRYLLHKLDKMNAIKIIDGPAILFDIHHNLNTKFPYDWDNINIKYMQDEIVGFILKDDSPSYLSHIWFNENKFEDVEYIEMLVGPKDKISAYVTGQ